MARWRKSAQYAPNTPQMAPEAPTQTARGRKMAETRLAKRPLLRYTAARPTLPVFRAPVGGTAHRATPLYNTGLTKGPMAGLLRRGGGQEGLLLNEGGAERGEMQHPVVV